MLTPEQILAFARTHGMFGFVGTEQLQDFACAIERAAREAAIEEDRRDAERYRYLRSKAIYEGSSDWTIEVWGRFASFEEALDAQIAAQKENGNDPS
jgi:hypothetical protein